MKHYFALAVSLLLLAGSVQAQNLVVDSPRYYQGNTSRGFHQLFEPDHTVRINWQAGYTGARVVAAQTNAGFQTSDKTKSAAVSERFIAFTPDELGLTVGKWLIRIEADDNGVAGRSTPATIYVESTQAPTAEVLEPDSPVPTFEITPVPGVPAYAIGLSSSEFSIEEDANGDLSVEGVSLIWDYVGEFSETSIAYGKGKTNPVPLIPGNTYYYTVLNAYEPGQTNKTSTVNGGVFSFTHDPQVTSLTPPLLNRPLDNSSITGGNITFQWDAVPEGQRYVVTVLEEVDEDGTLIEQDFWSTTILSDGTGGQQLRATFPARDLVTEGTFYWYVSVQADGFGTVVSDKRTFTYSRPLTALTIRTFAAGNANTPLADVNVAVTSDSYTPPDGELDMEGGVQKQFFLPGGEYNLTFTKEGYREQQRSVTLQGRFPRTLNANLLALPTPVEGVIRDEEGVPLANADVIFTRIGTGGVASSNSGNLRAVADAQGRFVVYVEVAGDYEIQARAPGYARGLETVTVETGVTPPPVEFALQNTSISLAGRVAFGGRPLAFAEVTAKRQSDDEERTTQTNAQGEYILTLEPGTWVITAALEGYQPQTRTTTLTLNDRNSNQAVRFNYFLRLAPQSVLVTVYSRETNRSRYTRVGGVTVTTTINGEEVTRTTDPNGATTFWLQEGEYQFTASAPDFIPSSPRRLTISENTRRQFLNLYIDRPQLRIAGTVRRNDNFDVIEGATARVLRCDRYRTAGSGVAPDFFIGKRGYSCITTLQEVGTATTDASGQFVVEGSALGRWQAYIINIAKPNSGLEALAEMRWFRGGSYDVEFALVSGFGTIQGTVTDEGGLPIGNGAYEIVRMIRTDIPFTGLNWRQIFFWAWPNSSTGAFSQQVPNGTYQVQAVDFDQLYQPGPLQQDVVVGPGAASPNYQFNLEDNSLILEGNVGLENAFVYFYPINYIWSGFSNDSEYFPFFWRRTSSDGSFAVRVASGYAYRVNIWRPGWLPIRFNTGILRADNAPRPETESMAKVGAVFNDTGFLNVSLTKAPATIAGTVTSANGDALADVSLLIRENGTPVDTVLTDVNGDYLVGVNTGAIDITTEYAGYEQVARTLSVSLGQELADVDFSLAEAVGTIRDQAGAPVAGATVDLVGPGAGNRTTTDAQGAYLAVGLVAGEYTAVVQREGFAELTIDDVTLVSGGSADVSGTLQQLNASLSGRIALSDGSGLSGANVTLLFGNGETFRTTSDDTGAYSFSGLPLGEATLTVAKEGFFNSEKPTVAFSGSALQQSQNISDLTSNDASLAGTVTASSTGNPLLNVTVEATGPGGTFTSVTNTQGRYQISGLPPGAYTVVAGLEGYANANESIQLAAGSAVDAPLSVTRNAGTIQGQLVDQQGAALALQADVIATGGGGRFVTRTDAQGVFAIGDLELDQAYRIATDIGLQGFEEASAEVSLPASGTASINLAVQVNTASISGNAGAAGVTLTLRDRDTQAILSTRVATTTGDFTLRLLPSGSYTLSPSLEGFAFSPSELAIDLATGQEATGTFTATSTRATLSASIVDTDGVAVQGVTVSAISTDTTTFASVSTSAEGAAVFDELAGGKTYVVTPTLDGFVATPASRTVALSEGATEAVAFTMTASTASMAGVASVQGQALQDVGIQARLVSSGQAFTTTQSGRQGYRFNNLPAGTYEVTARKTGFLSDTLTVALAGGEEKTGQNLTLLAQNVQIRGRVLYAGEGVQDVNVEAVGSTTITATTNADGVFTLNNVPAGIQDTTVYAVQISGEDVPSRSQLVSIAKGVVGERVQIDDFILPSGQIQLLITDGVEPLQDVAITLSLPGGQRAAAETNTSGVYTTAARLGEGVYRLTVSAEGYLRPVGDVLSVELDSDTESLAKTIALPYQLVVPAEVAAGEDTPISVVFRQGYTPANGTATLFYRLASQASFAQAQLARDGSAFMGDLPALFSLEDISYYVQVTEDGAQYRSREVTVTPTAKGVLTNVQIAPNLDNVLLRTGDTYTLALALRDGIGESLQDDFVGSSATGAVTWSASSDVVSFAFPDASDPTVVALSSAEAGTFTVEAEAQLGGALTTVSFLVDVTDSPITDLSLSAPVTRVSNQGSTIQFAYSGTTETGAVVTLGDQLRWSVAPASAGTISADGAFTPTDAGFIGSVAVVLQDSQTSLMAETPLAMFARVLPDQAYALNNGEGVLVNLAPGAFPFPAEVSMRPGRAGPSKQFVYDAAGASYTVAQDIYRLAYRANQPLVGDSLRTGATISLPLSVNDSFAEGERVVGLYSLDDVQWRTFSAQESGSVIEAAGIRKLGEFAVLTENEPLGLKHVAVIPNPFSPQVSPLRLGYYLSSAEPPVTVDIRIYNMRGELVRTLLRSDVQNPGRYGSRTSLKPITWDGLTDSGMLARNGRYLIQIKVKDSTDELTELVPVVLVK